MKDGTVQVINAAKEKIAKSGVRVKVATLPDGTQLYICEIREKTKKPPTDDEILERIRELGLCDRATQILTEEYLSRRFTKTHLNDLQKANQNYGLAQLTPDQQCHVVLEVPRNRAKQNLLNDEEVATFALQNGDVNSLRVEVWYAAVIRLIEKLLVRLEVAPQSIDQLSQTRRTRLRLMLSKLIPVVERTIDRL